MSAFAVLSLSSFSCLISALSLPLPHQLVTQFPIGTWVENIAVRPNGDLLVTWLSPNASVVQVSKPYSAEPDVSVVHTFSGITSLSGIVESRPDVFVAVGGQLNLTTFEPVNGSMAAFELDFSSYKAGSNQAPRTVLLANLTEAQLPNGLTRLPEKLSTVLIGDSLGGVVFRLDTLTGEYSIALDVPEFKPNSTVGVNGLKTHKGYLYWTNSGMVEMYRIAIDGQTGSALTGASVEKYATPDAEFLDDMVFGPGDSDLLWAFTNYDARVLAVYPNGTVVVVEGAKGSDTVIADTAGTFGRTSKDSQILYVVTGGNSTFEGGGKIVAVDSRHRRGPMSRSRRMR